MPNTREKLIELIERAKHSWSMSTMTPLVCTFASWIADHLIANGVTIQKWIPVTERLPEPLTKVLSYGHGCFDVDMVDGGVWDSAYYSEYSVTHWMPLPEPPKGE